MQTIPAADDAASLLMLIGYSKGNSCGISYYCGSKHLTNEHYQILLDRGWRRSGSTLYKPDLLASCCAQYTVRLDSSTFHATKDQRQSVNRLNRYILGDSYLKSAARLVPLSREQAKKRDTEFDLVERIHESESDRANTSHNTLQTLHEFEVTIESNEFTDEKYAIFENYQRSVHHEGPEKITERGFTNFLCKSPLPTQSVDGNLYGSYHQCYRIDGKLVAVGVIDLLPHCVSGVYFFYHESVQQHCFGKLGALREIALAKEKGYRYWYPGFYIQNCTKMKYKGDFNPQSFLDPESNTWEPLDATMKSKLDKQKYISPSRERLQIPYPPEAAYPAPPPPAPKSKPNIADTPTGQADQEIRYDDSDVEGQEDIEEEEDEEDEDLIDSTFSLHATNMPGIMSRAEVLETVDLDMIKIRIRGTDYVTSDLMKWADDDVDDPKSLKGLMAGFAAALGAEVVRDAVVFLG